MKIYKVIWVKNRKLYSASAGFKQATNVAVRAYPIEYKKGIKTEPPGKGNPFLFAFTSFEYALLWAKGELGKVFNSNVYPEIKDLYKKRGHWEIWSAEGERYKEELNSLDVFMNHFAPSGFLRCNWITLKEKMVA